MVKPEARAPRPAPREERRGGPRTDAAPCPRHARADRTERVKLSSAPGPRLLPTHPPGFGTDIS